MQTATQIIDLLGGSAAISRETGWALTTIESWKASNFIPEWRRDPLLVLARKLDKSLAATHFPDRRRAPAQRVAA
jgi:hypothetical protein